MRKLTVITLSIAFVLGMMTQGWATMYKGCLTNDSINCPGGFVGSGGLDGKDGWGDNFGTTAFADITLTWIVDDTTNPGFWTYAYTFTVDQKSPSHHLIEVSLDFTESNIEGTDGDAPFQEGPKWFHPSGGTGAQPNMPGDLFGLKFDSSQDGLTDTWIIVSDKAPMWGDFYSKNGKSDGIFAEAWNTGFGIDVIDSPTDGNNPTFITPVESDSFWAAWALVPDTDNGGNGHVPEPGTLVLLGSGLIGLAIYSRRRLRG